MLAHPLGPFGGWWQNHQPYPHPHQSGGVYQRQGRSLLGTVAEFPKSKRQDLICVVVHSKRQSAATPWGIAFSKFDDRIVLGKVHENGRQIIDWCHNIHCSEHFLDSRVVFSPMLTPFEHPEIFRRRLRAHVSGMASLDARHQQLWPGDLLLSIDGFDPSCFHSLMAFTDYIRNVNHFTFVVLRHPEAATAALAHQDVRISNQPFLAATSADGIWRQVFRAMSMPSTPNPVPSSNIARQVTPDRNLGGKPCVSAGYVSGPRSLFEHQKTTGENPLDLLSRVAEASKASIHSFQSARDASSVFLKKPPPPTKVPSASNLSNKATSASNSGVMRIPSNWRNPWFKNEKGENLPFDDNLEFSPEDGQRAKLFLPPIKDFPAWLAERKHRWKQTYKVYKYDSEKCKKDALEIEGCTVAHDFWTHQGFTSFDDWMTTSLSKWKLSYSWNKKKTQRIQEECEAVVHISQEPRPFQHWLRIRRNQWRLLRRKRQRQRNEEACINEYGDTFPRLEVGSETAQGESHEDVDDQELLSRKRRKVLTPAFTDMAAIDVILEQEDQERKRRKSEKRRLDISFLFHASLGAPDDIVVLCFSFLDRSEYSKLLCINKAFSGGLKARAEVWRRLCPSNWILPRRPRKPWHELYFHRLRIEQRDSQKLWDDLLVKCSGVLFKGDHLQKVCLLSCHCLTIR